MQRRNLFGKNKSSEDTAEKSDSSAQKEQAEEPAKEEPAKEEPTDKKEESSSPSSGSEEEVELSAEDIKKIKALIKDQDETIEGHEKKLEEQTKLIKELKQKLAYQLAENDNTVKRYRKQIEEGKQFAITKFAKELLDVRDALALALQHCKVEELDALEDLEVLKEQYRNVVQGQKMTTDVMDKVLGKFDVT